MSLIVIEGCARVAGVPSHSLVELYCQNAYMVFQVVQVFLITTLTSAASAAFTQVLENPPSATTLLSENLPKASNFYVSYFVLQGLATSASRLVHFPALIRHQILRNSSDNPRFLSRKWHRLRHIHWGGVFPVYTNMAIIGKFIKYHCAFQGRRCYAKISIPLLTCSSH
jgi:calcium permeable stress-gated cation channel